MTNHQTFADPGAGTWLRIEFPPGVELLPLAQPVPDGSIHRAPRRRHDHPGPHPSSRRIRARAVGHNRNRWQAL